MELLGYTWTSLRLLGHEHIHKLFQIQFIFLKMPTFTVDLQSTYINTLQPRGENKSPNFTMSKKKTKNKKRSILHTSLSIAVTPPAGSGDQFCDQRLVWPAMSELEPRLSSAM